MSGLPIRSLCVLAAAALATGSGAAVAATPSTAAPHTVTYTLVTEPTDGYTAIYNLIGAAKTSIDMTMYELTDTTAEQDLAAAAKRGVKVRVILDQNLEKSSNTTAYNYLNANGVPTVWASKTYAATHQKTVTIDDTTSAIMTGNLTSQYYSTSRDFAVIENNSLDVKAIEKVFNADYAGTAITPTDGDHLVWSPTDSQSQILALINGATKTLSVENEEMGDATVTTALENAAKRGVNVEVIMTNDDNEYGTEFDALTAAGVHVHTYAYTASLYIHAKAIVADYGTSAAQVFAGSENFSNASLNENRELGFLTNNTTIISGVQSALASDYAGGTNWS
ncbi:phospholipase D-like domain-containing protein [Streptomyces sp. SL13]|jgi:cardiolipin synthase|uniref:phospholipase D n=1 Tax=Streptantibioticus silvisoli TaxID=2705255 RepID=A0AA90KAQ3_9ACTN|nr:phospholipase D-like domain-containing protein [Streptantibioticus silvisoli]MDI5961771.1 phospholipase D-like domain-containing protein [Streptantibioticus silvisoli]MDI5972387.1 phospholipase D-like domain-containing protein [Streptantibioticus silvisoli]